MRIVVVHAGPRDVRLYVAPSGKPLRLVAHQTSFYAQATSPVNQTLPPRTPTPTAAFSTLATPCLSPLLLRPDWGRTPVTPGGRTFTGAPKHTPGTLHQKKH